MILVIIKFKMFYIICAAIYFCITVPTILSQSPYSSVKFELSDTSQKNYTYTVNQYICNFNYEPVVPSGNYWFGKDTSKLNWRNLPDSLINSLGCKKVNAVEGKIYEYGNQQMISEHIITITITRQRSNRKTDEDVKYDTMIIVMPVLLKSFVTYIDLGTITFNKGYYSLEGFVYDWSDWLKISLPAVINWQSVGFDDRKIKINPIPSVSN